MLVARRVLFDVIDLLVKITFHPAAYRRIELSKIADLHVFVMLTVDDPIG